MYMELCSYLIIIVLPLKYCQWQKYSSFKQIISICDQISIY